MARNPNILVITTHDTGRHFGCYGVPTVHTPNIDAIAAGGVHLTNYFAASPICSAARAAMMTGQYPQTNGQMDLCFSPFDYDLRDYRHHASHVFRDAGYRSLLFGFQHETAHVDRLGFDERRVDDAVGIITRALETTGHDRDTLLVFAVDHGMELPRAKWSLYDPGLEVALVMRWPAGGVEGGRTCDWLLSQVDFLPTVLELAGRPASPVIEGVSFAAGARGESASPPRDAIYAMFQKGQNRCVRNRDYKRIRNFGFGLRGIPGFFLQYSDESLNFNYPPAIGGHKYNLSRSELYDLAADTLEFNSLAGKEETAAVEAELDALLWSWMEAVDDPLIHGPERTPFYDSAMADYAAWKQG